MFKLLGGIGVFMLFVTVAESHGQARVGVESPQVHEDGSVTFALLAPEAETVAVHGHWSAEAQPMTRGESGVWELRVEQIPAEIWEYSFVVDGVAMADPSNRLVKASRSPKRSLLHIPADPPSLQDPRAVPHGVAHVHTYESEAAGDSRQYVVYTPAGYGEDAERLYPLLVLQHGSGDTEMSWLVNGSAGNILDNLLAEGRIEPMVVLMLNGHVTKDRDANTAAFEADLLEQVLPAAESAYRVRPGSENRALVGLSMGGHQALSVGLNHTDRFAWIGSLSGGLRDLGSVSSAIQQAEQTNERLKLLYIACGVADGAMERNRELSRSLTEAGIENQLHETEGGHSWPVWRKHLADLLPRLFVEADGSATP